MKTVNIKGYVYEKVQKEDIPFNIPTEPLYYQSWNYRVVTAIFPQFATWSDNSVWELQIVRIGNDSINFAYIRMSELSEIYTRLNIKKTDSKDCLRDDVFRHLKEFSNDDITNHECFENKLLEVTDRISALRKP